MVGNDERRSFVSDLVEIKDDMQENDVPISDNGDDKSDQETDGEEEKESCVVEAASNGENRGTNLTHLIPLELDLHEEVAHSVHEQQDENLVQVSEKLSLDESLVDGMNVSVGFQESSEVDFLMINQCDECNENLAVMSYEDDLQYIQTTEDQTIQGFQILLHMFHVLKCFSNKRSAHLFVQNFLGTRSRFSLKYILKKDQKQVKKTPCSFSKM